MCETQFSSTLQERKQCLQELTDFTESCQAELKDLLEALGWSPEFNANAAQMEVCPYDPNHTVPRDRMEKHKASCQLSQLGYTKEEQLYTTSFLQLNTTNTSGMRAEMCDPSVYYEKMNIPSIIIDKETLQQVILQAQANAPPMRSEGLYAQCDYSSDPPDVPHNHERALCDLTVADRVALFDHVTQEASQQCARKESNNEDLYVDLVAKLKKGDKQSGPKSHLEVLAEMRDYRRRRQSYRAKNVHITKKSYTEVIREVIDVHSEELSRIWQEDKEEEESKASQHSSHRRTSEKDRSASRNEHGRKRHRKRSRSRKRSRELSKERESKSKRESRSPDAERHHKKKKKKNKS